MDDHGQDVGEDVSDEGSDFDDGQDLTRALMFEAINIYIYIYMFFDFLVYVAN